VAPATGPDASAPKSERAATAPPAEQAPAADEQPAAPSAEPPDDDKASGGAARSRRAQYPVMIKSDPDGTRVATGRHVFGTTPLTLKLRPGNSYELTFTKAGYAPVTRRYRFDEQQSQTLRVTLKKLADAKKPVAPTPAKLPPPPVLSPAPQKKGWFGR
jgi:hypothetical protein